MWRRHRVVLLGVCLLLGGCRSATAPGSEAAIAGTYALSAVAGRGAVSGSVVLSADGGAERRVEYPSVGAGAPVTSVARGTFARRPDGSLDLRLREGDGKSASEWRPAAALAGLVLTLRYPDPADAGTIVETYTRQ